MKDVTIPFDLFEKLYKFYNIYWEEIATVDLGDHGYNGISFDDTNKLDEAAAELEDYAPLMKDLLKSE